MADERRTIPLRYADPALESDDAVYPRLTDDARIFLTPEDGDKTVEFEARVISHYLWTLKFGVTLANTLNIARPEETTTRLFQVSATITDARVAYMIFDKKEGQFVVGQVRYQWLDSVGFHPNQGFLFDPEIELEFTQDFPLADRGIWTHRIALGFKKSTDPSNLAMEILRRAARFRLADGGPQDARAELERLANLQSLDIPTKKGEFASAALPGAARFPGLVYPAPGDVSESDSSPMGADIPGPNVSNACDVAESEASALESDPPQDYPFSPTADLPRIRIGQRVRAMRLIARAQRALTAERHPEAALQFDAALAILDANQPILPTSQKIDLLLRSAFAHLPSDREVALKRVESAIAFARQHHEEALERDVRQAAEDLVDGAPEHEFVLPNLRRLVALADLLGTRVERAEARTRLARRYRDGRMFTEAIEQFTAAAELFDDAGETWDAARSFGELGDLYRNVGAITESRNAIELARTGFEKSGDIKNVAVAVQILAELDT